MSILAKVAPTTLAYECTSEADSASFVVGIGGAVGWASFAVACFAILIIGGVCVVSLK